jgi:hypothetical protein
MQSANACITPWRTCSIAVLRYTKLGGSSPVSTNKQRTCAVCRTEAVPHTEPLSPGSPKTSTVCMARCPVIFGHGSFRTTHAEGSPSA